MPEDNLERGIFIMNKDKKKETKSNLKPIEIKPRVNKFVDDLTLDTADLKIIGTQKQVPRGERVATKIKVVCDICGVEEEIPESLSRKDMIYKCNNCCTAKGRREAKKKMEQ